MQISGNIFKGQKVKGPYWFKGDKERNAWLFFVLGTPFFIAGLAGGAEFFPKEQKQRYVHQYIDTFSLPPHCHLIGRIW